MKWVKLKVIRFLETLGTYKDLEYVFNAYNIIYVDTSNEDCLLFQLVGDSSKYFVKDKDSINRLLAILSK